MRFGGSIQSKQIGNPAAGADWSAVVPAGQYWEVWSCSFLLTTGVAVANRAAGIVVQDTVPLVHGIWRSGTLQTASLAWLYTGFAHAIGAVDPNNNANGIMIPCPAPRRLPPGWFIGSAVHGIQAADQISAISLLVEVFQA